MAAGSPLSINAARRSSRTWLNASHTSTRPPAHPSVMRRIVSSWGVQAKAIQHRIKNEKSHRLKTPGPHCPAPPVPGGCAATQAEAPASPGTREPGSSAGKRHPESWGSATGCLRCRKAGRGRPSQSEPVPGRRPRRGRRRSIRRCGPNRLPVPRVMAGFFKKEETSWLGRDALRA
jgi:hypothetical protein